MTRGRLFPTGEGTGQGTRGRVRDLDVPRKSKILVILALLHCFGSPLSLQAATGAAVPWITYEAEDMLVGGGTILGPEYSPIKIPTEASGRRCVQLNGTGQYVQFTNQSAATALVVRYCVPDTSDGVGADYTLGLYTNGVLAARLPMTSKYSWLYGNYPFTNNPTAGFARNFFDEVRANGLILNAGTVVRLQKDAVDTAAYYIIDLVDVENVPAALTQPVNSIAVTNYGAVGDGLTDCTSAFQNCLADARSQNKTLWISAGDFLITGTINLYSNTRIIGAGMWYSKLVGSPSFYATPARRVNLNGSGSNIILSDFAIVGCLNYRKDTEGNDGLGGSYGTGSSISRIWVEHTKAAAWIFNSSGLVIDGCRFRDTLADGINVNYAMQNTVITNCAARGTGDDCFAIWPSPNSGNYAPGNNVFTHCTGQLPFLANGGAVYGGANNRIEDSLFSDISYGCGLLFSTTFNVSFTFSGMTVAQRCELLRCGGYDGGYGWRSAVQIVMDNPGYHGISGLNLNNLEVIDSISSGLSILGDHGPLTNATATSVNIPDYNINSISGQHAWWAGCLNGCPGGSLTVSNSIVPEYENDSSLFNFHFLPAALSITGLSLTRGNGILLSYNTSPGFYYHIETTTNLVRPFWSSMSGSASRAPGTSATFTDTNSPAGPQRFYRTVSP